MIKSIAEFITKMKEKESEMLSNQKIDHPGMIGDMFEGLTHRLLALSMPINLNLNIRSGKIINEFGEESKQIDCMVVVGDGEQIPYTKWYKYRIENVIAVIEVKKTLYFDDLVSSYQNLESVLKKI